MRARIRPDDRDEPRPGWRGSAMKQIRVHGPNDVRLDDIPRARPRSERDALVRVAACGICGSDVSFVHMGGTHRSSPWRSATSWPASSSGSGPK